MKRNWSTSLMFVQMRLEPIIEDAVEHEQKKSSKRTLPADYGDSLAKRGSVRDFCLLFIVQVILCSVRYRTNFPNRRSKIQRFYLLGLILFIFAYPQITSFLSLSKKYFLNLTRKKNVSRPVTLKNESIHLHMKWLCSRKLFFHMSINGMRSSNIAELCVCCFIYTCMFFQTVKAVLTGCLQ